MGKSELLIVGWNGVGCNYIPNPQSPIPNPQYLVPSTQSKRPSGDE